MINVKNGALWDETKQPPMILSEISKHFPDSKRIVSINDQYH